LHVAGKVVRSARRTTLRLPRLLAMAEAPCRKAASACAECFTKAK